MSFGYTCVECERRMDRMFATCDDCAKALDRATRRIQNAQRLKGTTNGKRKDV